MVKVRSPRRRGQRPKKEQRNRRNQLEHMLSRHASPARLDSLRVHRPVHSGSQSLRVGLRVVRAPPVPYTSHIISGNDLDEVAGLDMSNLDEPAVEKQDVWQPAPPCLPTRSYLFDGLGLHVYRHTVQILWKLLARSPQAPRETRTIVAEQELVLVRPEHTHGPTRLTPLREVLQSGVFLLRVSNTLEATWGSVKIAPLYIPR